MSEFIFNGHDFGELADARVLDGAGHPVSVTAQAVPGRAGAMLLADTVMPKRMIVRIWLKPEYRQGSLDAADVRRRIASWLYAKGGGELCLPEDGGLTYRDVVCTACGEWSSVKPDAWCDVELTAYDPIAYGAQREYDGAAFAVGGTWWTAPVIELVTEECDAVAVAYGGCSVQVAGPFEEGQLVVIDCGNETVTIDGEAADECVALGSDFFKLVPGAVTIMFVGAESHTVRFTERWL